MKTALSIAGSDPSGGAGIQADLKTMAMNGVYGMSAVTALTAQNTTGVRGILEVDPGFLESQIDAVFEDIFPDAVKIGMVASCGLIEKIGERLRRPAQGRAQHQRRQRFSLRGRCGDVVLWNAHRQSQHPRHRLYPVQCHCRQSGKRL